MFKLLETSVYVGSNGCFDNANTSVKQILMFVYLFHKECKVDLVVSGVEVTVKFVKVFVERYAMYVL